MNDWWELDTHIMFRTTMLTLQLLPVSCVTTSGGGQNEYLCFPLLIRPDEQTWEKTNVGAGKLEVALAVEHSWT